jgi:phage-related protein
MVIAPKVETEEAESRFEKFFQKIKDGFELVRDTAKSVFDSIVSWFDKNFSGIFDGIFSGLQRESRELLDTFAHIGGDLSTLMKPLKDYFNNDFTPWLQTVFTVCGNIVTGLFDTFNMVFRDIWDVCVFPLLSSLINDALPMLTQFSTQSFITLNTLFTDIKSIFDKTWTEYIKPALEFITEVITDTMSIIKDKWNEYGAPIFEALREAIDGTTEELKQFMDEWIKPVFDEVMSAADELWNEHLAPLVDNVLGLLGDIGLAWLNFYNTKLLPVISWIQKHLAPIVTGVLKDVVKKIKKNIGFIIDTFNGVITFLRGVFRGDWSMAWGGIVKVAKASWDLIVGVIKAPINMIIDLVNGMIAGVVGGFNGMKDAIASVWNAIADNLNSFSFEIPDWVPEWGGNSWSPGLPYWYPENVSPPQIPRLASGTVVPANYGEFLAVLGDNKREAEIVSPISAMKQALMEAMVEVNGASGAGGQKVQLVVPLYINGREIGRAVVDDINAQIRQTGKSPIKA